MATKTLKERVQRLKDIHAVNNLMSKYQFLHTAGMEKEVLELFALNTPGVSAEIANWGVYEGPEGLRKLYLGVYKNNDGTGTMRMHPMTSAVVEIAGDCKTAKGAWIVPGHETRKENRKFQAYWAWWKYGVDLVKEDGNWKIWHLHIYGILMTPYEKSWVEFKEHAKVADITSQIPEDLRADRPPSHPLWMYSTTSEPENVPELPRPYRTFDETTRY